MWLEVIIMLDLLSVIYITAVKEIILDLTNDLLCWKSFLDINILFIHCT